MGKPHILGLLFLFLAGCIAVPGGGPDLEAAEPAPSVNELSAEIQQPEPDAPLPEQQPAVQLEDYGPAPELTNEVWLNTPRPLRLADLRGQVVLLDMWTFG